MVATAIVATGIVTDFVKWDSMNRDFVSTNELSRAFLASFILIMDLLIVMQVSIKYLLRQHATIAPLRGVCVSVLKGCLP